MEAKSEEATITHASDYTAREEVLLLQDFILTWVSGPEFVFIKCSIRNYQGSLDTKV